MCIEIDFLPFLSRFNLPERIHVPVSVTRIAFWINLWVLNKNFQVIKLFIYHCSLITLAQSTIVRLQIVRFLEAPQMSATPHSWIKTKVLFLCMFRWIAIHFLIHLTCRSRILQCAALFPQLVAWILLKALEWSLFSVLCLRFYILAEKVTELM